MHGSTEGSAPEREFLGLRFADICVFRDRAGLNSPKNVRAIAANRHYGITRIATKERESLVMLIEDVVLYIPKHTLFIVHNSILTDQYLFIVATGNALGRPQIEALGR